MHCQQEFEADIAGHTLISDTLLMKWANDRYSTSKHLLTLYAVATGLKPRRLLEVGTGRSSFVLARVAAENNASLVCCDTEDFSQWFSDEEKKVVRNIRGYSHLAFNDPELRRAGADFIFLDYFGTDVATDSFVRGELKAALSLLPTNGILAIHDAIHPKSALPGVLRRWKWKPGVEVITLPYNYGLALLRRTSASPYGRIDDAWIKKSDI